MDGSRFPVYGTASQHRSGTGLCPAVWGPAVHRMVVQPWVCVGTLSSVAQAPCLKCMLVGEKHLLSLKSRHPCHSLFSSVTFVQSPCQLSKRVQLIIHCLWIFHIPFKNVTTGVKCGLECWMPVPAAKLVTCCWLSAGPISLCSAPYPFVFWFYVVHMFCLFSLIE